MHRNLVDKDQLISVTLQTLPVQAAVRGRLTAPVWLEQSCIRGLLRPVTSSMVTADVGLECQHSQMLFVAAESAKCSQGPSICSETLIQDLVTLGKNT